MKRKYLAEFFGTAVLVLFGCGAAAVSGCTDTVNSAYLATAMAFGMALTVLVYSIGPVSGCHVNPAVSIAMWLNGRITTREFFGYAGAQLLGGIFGAWILELLIGREYGLAANHLYLDSIGGTIAVEAVITCLFVTVVLEVTDHAEYRSASGLVIGLALTLAHLFGIWFTGASVNPARSLGPALLTGGQALADVWVFLLAPLIGGVGAAVLWRLVCRTKKS